MKVTTDGVVIKVEVLRDYDRIITILTRDMGVIKAFCVGAQKVKSKKSSSTSLFAYSKFSLTLVKDLYRIDDAWPIEMFFGISRSGIEVSSVASYLCELTNYVVPKEENTEIYLRLLLNTLYFLSKENSDYYLLKAIYELRLMTMCGYMPNLVACEGCAAYEKEYMYFDIESATLTCTDCCDIQKDNTYLVDKPILSAMRHIVYSEFNKLFNFSLVKEKSHVLTSITELYVVNKTEKNFRTLYYLHNLDKY